MEINGTCQQSSSKGLANYFTGTVRGAIRQRGRPVTAPVRRWIGNLKVASRRQPRASLPQLDDYLLRDIGLTRDDVWREANKPIWRE